MKKMDKSKAIPKATPEDIEALWTINVNFLREILDGVDPDYAEGLGLEETEQVIIVLLEKGYLKATEPVNPKELA